jgi:hypothetical protein
MKRFVSCFFILILVLMMMGLSTRGDAQPKDDPVKIDFAYAIEKIRQGDTWRVYLSVTDGEGKMNRIFFRAIQFGGGDSYRPTFVYLTKGMQKQFTGHFDLHTGSTLELKDLDLFVTIVDREGKTRKIVSFPLVFADRSEPMKPLPPELEKDLNRRIGLIDINWEVSADSRD